MPETFFPDIFSKTFWIKVDLPHRGLPVIKIFILNNEFGETQQVVSGDTHLRYMSQYLQSFQVGVDELDLSL